MMSSPKTPAPAATLGNIDAKKLSTNEQSIPVPYLSGRAWLAPIQAQTNIYAPKSKAVTSKVGKSKQVTGYEYSGSLVGVLCCGALDLLECIEVAGKVVWSAPGGIVRDGDHVHHTGDIVIPSYGTFRLYWGTPDQPNDDLVLATCGEEHPGYLDLAYFVAKDLVFGNNNATPPTIRFLVERAARFPGLDESRSREGSNPVTAMAEVIGNEFFGLGLPEIVHVASAAALADAIRRDTPVAVPGDPDHIAAMGFVSAVLDRQQPAQSFFARLMEHYDGWVRPIDGQLKFGQFPHDGVTPTGLPELSYHDFVMGKRPRFEPSDDDDLITDVTVVHVDRDYNMEKAATPVPNPAARRRLGYSNPRTFQRPFLCTVYQAQEQGNQLARHYSRDEESCTVSVRREKVVGLHAGDLFVLVDAPSESSQVVRIVERNDPSDGGEVALQLVLERGLAPLAFVAPPNPRPTLPDPALVAIVHARAVQLPSDFGDYAPAPAVVILAERPGAHVAGYMVNFSNAGLTYDLLTTEGRWALRGTLAVGVTAVASTFIVDASGFDIARLAAQSDAARDDDTLLLFIGFELCSVGNVVALGGGQYQVDVLRGRRGSAAAIHALGSEIFLMTRAELEVFQHADFPRSTATRYFKLASYVRSDDQELADALEISLLFDDTNVDPPGTLAAVGKAEAIFISWTYPNPPDPTIIATDLWIRGAAAPVPNPAVDVPTHSLLATGFNLGGLAAGTTKYIWAQNRDTIGGRSTLVGYQTATAVAAPTGPAGAAGAAGAPGAAGAAGPTGADGTPGPGVPFRGNYDNTKAYYFILGLRRDAVFYSGQYWATNNAAKNGLTTWDPPGVGADWMSYGATYSAVATALLLAEDATITRTLTMGTVGSDVGTLQSANWVANTSGWRIRDGDVEFNGGKFSSGSGTSKFALDGSTVVYGDLAGQFVRMRRSGSNTELSICDGGTEHVAFGVNSSIGDTYFRLDGGALNWNAGQTTLAALHLNASSSSDPRTTDAPLYSSGGAFIAKSLDVDGKAAVNGGSASIPAYAFRGDLDTGIYSDEANKVKVACGGSQVARFVNSGGLFFIMEAGCTMRLGNTRAAITSETLQYYVTAIDASGNALKLAVLN